MKVLLSAYALLPQSGGENGFGWNWTTHLAREVEFVEVVTRLRNREATEKYIQSHDFPPNVRFHYVDLPGFLRGVTEIPSLYYPFWQVAAFLYARRHLKVDLVHHVSFGSLQGGSWMGLLGVPLVFGPVGGGQIAPREAREFFPPGRWRGETLRTLVTRLVPFSPLHRLMAQRAAVILATNEPTARLARRLGGRVVEFIDSGLSQEYVQDTVPPREPGGVLRVLWVGRLIPRKALRLALESVAACRVPVHLTVVGAGEQADEVPGWLEQLGLTGQVTVCGGLPWQEMKALYDTSDVFLFTSLRESFGTQLMEAAARGLPIVTLNLNGARFLPDGFTVKVPLGPVTRMKQELARALESLYHTPLEERERMSREATAFAARETWSARARRIRSLYEHILR